MARHPQWFERLDAILEVVRASVNTESLGRAEMKAVFACSERDSIRLLHQFGAREQGNALALPRSSLLPQLEAIRGGETFAAFARQRQGVARQLAAARAEMSARRFRVPAATVDEPRLEALPETIRWRRSAPAGPARFEIVYEDGADLMWQLAEFLRAAGVHRAAFFDATEPADDTAR